VDAADVVEYKKYFPISWLLHYSGSNIEYLISNLEKYQIPKPEQEKDSVFGIFRN